MRSLGKKTHFGAFLEAKKSKLALSAACTKVQNTLEAIPLGPSQKNSFCAKAQRKRNMCDPYGKNPILGPSQRLKKLTGALSCMHKGPQCIQSLWDHPKKIPFVQKHKESAICAILKEKKPILGPSQRLKKLTGALSHMHKGPNCIESLWDHPKKIPFVQKHKESAICAILRENPHFGAFPEVKTANWCSQLHAQSSKMHSIPLGPSQKNSFCTKAQRKRDMCDP